MGFALEFCSGVTLHVSTGERQGRLTRCSDEGSYALYGFVCCSSQWSRCRACARVLPHIAAVGFNEAQTAGRSGAPKILHRSNSSS
jgi:hypothetical protein